MKNKIENLLLKCFGNKVIFVTAISLNNPLKEIKVIYGSKCDRNLDAAMVMSNLKLYGLTLKAMTRRRTKKIVLAQGFHRLQ